MSKGNIILLTALLTIALLIRLPENMNVWALPMVALVPLILLRRAGKPKGREDDERERRGRSDVRAMIPRAAPRRESPLITEAAGKLRSLRTMAELIRKAPLRVRIMEVCDFAEIVVETMRRMPSDTPSAHSFVETSLERFREALDRCFEIYRSGEKSPAGEEDYDVECFGAFISLFRKHQEGILSEGLGTEPAPTDDLPQKT